MSIQPSLETVSETLKPEKTMSDYGESFIRAIPRHIESLWIPGRKVTDSIRREKIPAPNKDVQMIQAALEEVLYHPITTHAQSITEQTFMSFIKKNVKINRLMRFFNGWNETHKTTSLVSAKVIMRLAADAVFLPPEQRYGYHRTMAHMHEVAKDDFGLGHKGHDGMYHYMTRAFSAESWMCSKYKVKECDEFSEFLYQTGIFGHKNPIDSNDNNQSILDAMMVSISSELWNGREYNFLSQFIEEKILSTNPDMKPNGREIREAKGYVFGHSSEVENKHGLHALAAAQVFCETKCITFSINRLQEIMLNYNLRVGKAFTSLNQAING